MVEIAMLKTGKRNSELMKTGFACPAAPVAQLDRVTDSDSVGSRFDSCRVHHNISDLQQIAKLKNTTTHCDKAKGTKYSLLRNI